jgi:hypothetical protein
MSNEEIKRKIESVRLCMQAHPDNTADSEFADRIADLVEIRQALNIPHVSKTYLEKDMDMAYDKGFSDGLIDGSL